MDGLTDYEIFSIFNENQDGEIMNTLSDIDRQHVLNIKGLLRKRFGSLVYRMYCYDARAIEPELTYFDLIIITSEKIDWRMEDKITDAIYYYAMEHNITFDQRFFSRDEFENKYKNAPFITEVKSEGIAV